MAFNRVILVGNIVADPELTTTPTGTSVTRFTIAVNRRFTRAGEQPQTDFFNIVAWRQTAEFVARFFTKGRPILVSGQLQNRNWTDNNGVKHYATEVIADEAYFVDAKGENVGAFGDAPAFQTQQAPKFEEVSGDDELPF